jgi:hypothetical protein
MTALHNPVAKTLIATSIALFAAGAFAQEATPAPELDSFKSTLSRADVRADAVQAGNTGLIARNDAQAEQIAARSVTMPADRAAVIADAVNARRLNLVAQGEA